MTTSNTLKAINTYNEAFVWLWLPNETDPVIAGRLSNSGGKIKFNYGKSYLERLNEGLSYIPIYEPELPLNSGLLPLSDSQFMPNCIRDASPDAWGRRVIIHKMFGREGSDIENNELGELAFLLKSGSDRVGALDFQRSPTEYVSRPAQNFGMEELAKSVEYVEEGKTFTPELEQTVLHCSTIGGARPKALFQEHGKKYIAKFSSSTDYYDVIKAEFIAMRLAAKVGLDVASVKLTTALNKDVLLIERFDRLRSAASNNCWTRRLLVSALTILGLDEMMARHASYEKFAEIIRKRFTSPKKTLAELFSRLVFNILCGNTDDHARNHAAFWDGRELTLTPAYDICPQGRSGNEASQAMKIIRENNLSQLKTCLQTAHNFMLSEGEAHSIFDNQIEKITQNWDSVCEEAELSEKQKKYFWEHQFLNPFSVQR